MTTRHELGAQLHSVKDTLFTSPERRKAHATAKEAIVAAAVKDIQEPLATYLAEINATIDITKLTPGTVFRVEQQMSIFPDSSSRQWYWGVFGNSGLNPYAFLLQHKNPEEYKLSYREQLQLGDSFYLLAQKLNVPNRLLSVPDFHKAFRTDIKNHHITRPLKFDIMAFGFRGQGQDEKSENQTLRRLIPARATIVVLK